MGHRGLQRAAEGTVHGSSRHKRCRSRRQAACARWKEGEKGSNGGVGA
jgi:hypothetical protein